jgi:membrane glycosyltransferase
MDGVVTTPEQNAALVPPHHPLAMPTQSFERWESKAVSWASLRVLFARGFVIVTSVALTFYATWEMFHVVGQTQATSLQILLVALFALTFVWIALPAATALLGFFLLEARAIKSKGHPQALTARTAILLPIYNEETKSVFSSVDQMMRELDATGHSKHFDLFVLSDSTDSWIASCEQEAVRKLRSELLPSLNVYYRRRSHNEGKKAGNIADFVRRWGGAYDFMIILDADSYMTADAILNLVKAMEEDPAAGLIQTVPRLANGSTLFARWQQFASQVYGPILAAGLALWHGREGNYWGHNAIIRVAAFAHACGLPVLPGRKPLGGHIMSHDFVEAALLRRAGFAVYMRPDISGSYEGMPPTFAEYAVRDRRWAQGNLQHSKILPAAGLHWMSRLHLLTGIMSYVASPIWLMFLITGVLLSWQAVTFPPDYFPHGVALFPTWPRFDAARALALLELSIVILLSPKLLAWLTALLDPTRRREARGAVALTLGVAGEIIFSALLAPVMMLVQTRFVVDILLGHDAGWSSQQRVERDLPFRAIAGAHAGHTFAGLALCLITYEISVQVWLWLLPVWLGLCMAIPTITLLSRGPETRAVK